MGTDISMYVEQRIDNEWYFVGQMVENEMHRYDPDDALEYRPESIYDRRHYYLFAVLAGVRNDQEEPFEPIAPLRGLPDNLSAELQVWYNYVLFDEETGEPNTDWLQASWLTLEELARFDWHGKRNKFYARVDERVKHIFHPDSSPAWNDWPEDIPISYHHTGKDSPYCNAIWTSTYAEAVEPFLTEILNGLLEAYGPTSDVRLVFDFAS
ncbi:hypothetical protein KSD_67200 [Ktedonobacter sp. SOSP1-85]|uniref:hypothetical protein n=1 Tax=Ktedonobacter sp. SOSP1-85 TaxID=2778367 RepID=UPI001915CA2B|nr:hypothetical protein [Ktedonobacter sp. SOSP1-85]GHO78949.1 hypothetical protein KSD_67200 [Ktedonobacter sp. SOSP1-85]